MAFATASKGTTAVGDINVTPLVDVMLVLLIIFMVTAPLLTAGVPVNLPESRAKPIDQDQKPVQITIDQAGKLYLDNSEVTEEGLPPLPGHPRASRAISYHSWSERTVWARLFRAMIASPAAEAAERVVVYGSRCCNAACRMR